YVVAHTGGRDRVAVGDDAADRLRVAEVAVGHQRTAGHGPVLDAALDLLDGLVVVFSEDGYAVNHLQLDSPRHPAAGRPGPACDRRSEPRLPPFRLHVARSAAHKRRRRRAAGDRLDARRTGKGGQGTPPGEGALPLSYRRRTRRRVGVEP